MKSKLVLTAILTCFLAFTSCSSDDDSPAPENPELTSELIGKWIVDGVSTDGGAMESWEDLETYFEFKSNGTLVLSSPGEESEVSTYSTSGGKLIIDTVEDGVLTFTVKLSGNELEITTSDIDADEDEGKDILTYYLSRV